MATKQNVKLGRKVAYTPQSFTSHPMLAMLDMDGLKDRARKLGRAMSAAKQAEKKARRQRKSTVYMIELFEQHQRDLREVQRAYRRRLEVMKMRGLS